MQMHISSGSAASLTCNSLTQNICQMRLQMICNLTHIWRRTDWKNKWNEKRWSNLCSGTAAPNNLLKWRPRSPVNHSALWLFLTQLSKSFDFYHLCSDSTTYYELKLNSLQLKILYFWVPTSFREWCNKETWKRSGYKTKENLVHLRFRRLLRADIVERERYNNRKEHHVGKGNLDQKQFHLW